MMDGKEDDQLVFVEVKPDFRLDRVRRLTIADRRNLTIAAGFAGGMTMPLQFDDPAKQASWEEWFAARPPAVRAMIERFPPGTTFSVRGRRAWVISYPEMEGGAVWLGLTHTDPSVDYTRAFAGRFSVCPDHLTDLIANRSITDRRPESDTRNDVDTPE